MMISIEDLASEIVKELESYSEIVTEGIKNATDIVVKEVNAEIKKHIIFKQHTGKYVKAFRIIKISENRYKKVKAWCVGNERYRLTHLLEKGHAMRQGGRTKAYPHIKYGEELAIKRMEELSKEAIQNANGH